MDLDITIINARHWTSKNDNKVYNTLDILLLSKENLIDTDKFKGYSVVTCFVPKNVLKEVNIFEPCKGHFDSKVSGLKSNLILKSITLKNGSIIDLS